MEIEVTPKKWYVVSGAAGTTVSKPDGTVVATVPDGGQASFYATTHTVEASDSAVEVVEATFKYAPAKLKTLGVFGRGESGGYIPVLFLESAAKQYIETGISPTHNTAVLCEAQTNADTGAKWLFANATAARDEEPDKRFWMTSTPNYGQGTSYIGLGSYSTTTAVFAGTNPSAKNVYGLKINEIIYGGVSRTLTGLATFSGAPTVTLFRHRRDQTAAVTRFWWCKFTEYGIPTRDYVPMLDKAGKPCMYDKVTKEPYYNANTTSADFTVGMTAAQARKLGSLPADAPKKTLTVSLPAAIVDGETVLDAAVQAALNKAADNGWDITIQTYTEA